VHHFFVDALLSRPRLTHVLGIVAIRVGRNDVLDLRLNSSFEMYRSLHICPCSPVALSAP
jgi:hypothetical protein